MGWLHGARRLASAASRPAGILLLDSSRGHDAEAVHAQALDLTLRRAGFRVLMLSSELGDERLERALRALDPTALVLCGPGADTPSAVKLVRKIREAGFDAPLYGFRASGLIGDAVPSAGDQPERGDRDAQRRPAPPRRPGLRLAGPPRSGGLTEGDHDRCRSHLLELRTKIGATAMVEAVDRALGLAEHRRYLGWRKAFDVSQDEHVSLLLGQPQQRVVEVPAAFGPERATVVNSDANLLARHHATAAVVIEGAVASNSQYPSCERHLPGLVARDDGHQLEEDVLGDVFGLVSIVNHAPDAAKHVIRVAGVEESQSADVASLSPGNSLVDHCVVFGPRPRLGRGRSRGLSGSFRDHVVSPPVRSR